MNMLDKSQRFHGNGQHHEQLNLQCAITVDRLQHFPVTYRRVRQPPTMISGQSHFPQLFSTLKTELSKRNKVS